MVSHMNKVLNVMMNS